MKVQFKKEIQEKLNIEGSRKPTFEEFKRLVYEDQQRRTKKKIIFFSTILIFGALIAVIVCAISLRKKG